MNHIDAILQAAWPLALARSKRSGSHGTEGELAAEMIGRLWRELQRNPDLRLEGPELRRKLNAYAAFGRRKLKRDYEQPRLIRRGSRTWQFASFDDTTPVGDATDGETKAERLMFEAADAVNPIDDGHDERAERLSKVLMMKPEHGDLVSALQRTRGNRSAAAKVLDWSPKRMRCAVERLRREAVAA